MGDLFHEDVPSWFIRQVLDVAADKRNRNKIFCFLTKRPERMANEINKWAIERMAVPPNWWCGISAENQQRLEERLPWLRVVLASNCFVSLEPLLGPVSIKRAFNKLIPPFKNPSTLVQVVITGAETGIRRRPCDTNWVRRIRDDCKELGIRFFLKQIYVEGKKTSVLDGVDYSRIPPQEVFGDA